MGPGLCVPPQRDTSLLCLCLVDGEGCSEQPGPPAQGDRAMGAVLTHPVARNCIGAALSHQGGMSNLPTMLWVPSLAKHQNTPVPSEQGLILTLCPHLCAVPFPVPSDWGLILSSSPHLCAVPFPSASQEQLQPPPKMLTLAVGSHVFLGATS